ncbi:MAG: ECF transporter S component [Lachnospiraceae bacterium]
MDMKNLLLVFIIINLIINICFFAVFELKKPCIRDFIPIAVICAAASLGRLIFSFIPQVQPVTSLVIITGSAYGSLYGYITGALCALISNMMLGQGPWTIFQMTAWGMVGLIAGIIGGPFRAKIYSYQKTKKGVFELSAFFIYGFISVLIFSIITDLMTISYLGNALSLSSAITVFITGILFNIGHGIFNSLLILLIYFPLKNKLIRCRRPHL